MKIPSISTILLSLTLLFLAAVFFIPTIPAIIVPVLAMVTGIILLTGH